MNTFKGGKDFGCRFGRIAKRKPLVAPALRFPNTSQSGIKGNAKKKYMLSIFLTIEKKRGILKLQNKGGSKSEKDFMHVAGVRALYFDAGRVYGYTYNF